METIVAFLKKYLVLILCGALVVAALGVGVWYLVKPTGDNQTQETGESTGQLDSDLDFDLGFGDPDEQGGIVDGNTIIITPDNQSGIVNVPGSDSSSGSVTPINPEDSNSSETKPNSGEETTGNSGASSNSGNSNGNTSSNPGSGEDSSDSDKEDSPTTPTENQSQPVDMVGSVVANPFN